MPWQPKMKAVALYFKARQLQRAQNEPIFPSPFLYLNVLQARLIICRCYKLIMLHQCSLLLTHPLPLLDNPQSNDVQARPSIHAYLPSAFFRFPLFTRSARIVEAFHFCEPHTLLGSTKRDAARLYRFLFMRLYTISKRSVWSCVKGKNYNF